MIKNINITPAPEKPQKFFPKLMIAQGELIVLMQEPGLGVAISGDRVGETSKAWNMSVFQDFNGEVTIANV